MRWGWTTAGILQSLSQCSCILYSHSVCRKCCQHPLFCCCCCFVITNLPLLSQTLYSHSTTTSSTEARSQPLLKEHKKQREWFCSLCWCFHVEKHLLGHHHGSLLLHIYQNALFRLVILLWNKGNQGMSGWWKQRDRQTPQTDTGEVVSSSAVENAGRKKSTLLY